MYFGPVGIVRHLPSAEGHHAPSVVEDREYYPVAEHVVDVAAACRSAARALACETDGGDLSLLEPLLPQEA